MIQVSLRSFQDESVLSFLPVWRTNQGKQLYLDSDTHNMPTCTRIYWEPVDSNDYCIIVSNIGKIHRPIIEDMNQITFSHIFHYPRQLVCWKLGMEQRGLRASQSCRNLAKNGFKDGTGNGVRKYLFIDDSRPSLVLPYIRARKMFRYHHLNIA